MADTTVLRGGLVVDGGGGEPYEADIALRGSTILDVGRNLPAGDLEEDVVGCVVTPGFVDIHTHYDAQATWSTQMSPSSAHGVTTVVVGNCGVGFAPCRPQDRQALVRLLEGVEDIPEAVMAEGLPWDWESFPEFLDSLDRRARDIDVAAYLPHSPLRVHVMGQRGLDREPATPADMALMQRLAGEAVRAGAIGFSTSRTTGHRDTLGRPIPSYRAAEDELKAIARGVADAGGGLLQYVFDTGSDETLDELASAARVARASHLPFTFALMQSPARPKQWRVLLDEVAAMNRDGLEVTGQTLPRPVGMLMGLNLSANPFAFCPSWSKVADLAPAARVAALRDPGLRAALLSETPGEPDQPLFRQARSFERMFELGDPPNYEPDPGEAIAARAAQAGIDPLAFTYDLLTRGDGDTLLFLPVVNYAEGNLDALREMLSHPDITLGLGDGGAHYGLICDSTFPTFALVHWARDRERGRLPLAHVVRLLSHDPARRVGLNDRGLIAPGYKADLNVIDMDRLRLQSPRVVWDLPGGGRRLNQDAEGIVATFVAGAAIRRNDTATGATPGSLVRGRRPAPAAAPL